MSEWPTTRKNNRFKVKFLYTLGPTLTIVGALAEPNLLRSPLALLQELEYYFCRSKREAF
jgi:hypothetical protein